MTTTRTATSKGLELNYERCSSCGRIGGEELLWEGKQIEKGTSARRQFECAKGLSNGFKVIPITNSRKFSAVPAEQSIAAAKLKQILDRKPSPNLSAAVAKAVVGPEGLSEEETMAYREAVADLTLSDLWLTRGTEWAIDWCVWRIYHFQGSLSEDEE